MSDKFLAYVVIYIRSRGIALNSNILTYHHYKLFIKQP